jgi:16S rRNA (guanine527-N7)-methyltransferase
VEFEEELAKVLPPDLPRRNIVVEKAARHLKLIVDANEQVNLTRIVSPREAAIKHVFDSIAPWSLFADARHVLDAGSGAGFPGIPLALVLPDTHFTLSESIQKKARCLDQFVDKLELANVDVVPDRAEAILAKLRVDVITARAMAPLTRALPLFAPSFSNGTRALLYKGPDAEAEISEASGEARKRQVRMSVIRRYDLPDELGTRTIIELSR